MAENQKQYIQKAELIEIENHDIYYIYVENRQWIESIYPLFLTRWNIATKIEVEKMHRQMHA